MYVKGHACLLLVSAVYVSILGPRYLPTENGAGYLQRVQIKPFFAEIFTYKSIQSVGIELFSN